MGAERSTALAVLVCLYLRANPEARGDGVV